MFPISTHGRLRDQLSAYVDGEVEGAAAQRLEKHLAGCDGCRLELEQLRATVAALHDLPEAQAPRSFTVSAERAAGRRPQTRAAAPLALGVRLAAAGVAVALAAVFVVDLGGLAGDNESGTTAERAASDRSAEYGVPADGAAETPGAGQAPTGAESDSGTPSQTSEVIPPAETGGGGIDALAAAEIGLGVTLGLLVLGSIGLAFAGRKT